MTLQTYEKMSISRTFTNWYLQNKRNLPWRDTQNPYEIWVSEVILQQTRVDQGLAYYHRFLEVFPTLDALAQAELTDVLKVWQGLGYYSRARNMHEGARYIREHFGSSFPPNYQQLLSIKGIGEYTAAAIGSFSFNLPYAVVDGNVSRVIARLFGIYEPINSTAGIKQIKQMAGEILDTVNPGIHNQAMMEFGAIQCTVHRPECNICPFSMTCHAFNRQTVNSLPVKIKKQKVRDRFFYYLVIHHQQQVALKQRTGKDIWEGLYEFPLIETQTPETIEKITLLIEWRSLTENITHEIHSVSKEYIQLLSHQKIHARFIQMTIKDDHSQKQNRFSFYPIDRLKDFPLHRLIEKYLTDFR